MTMGNATSWQAIHLDSQVYEGNDGEGPWKLGVLVYEKTVTLTMQRPGSPGVFIPLPEATLRQLAENLRTVRPRGRDEPTREDEHNDDSLENKRETQWCMNRARQMFPEIVKAAPYPDDWVNGEPPAGSDAARRQKDPDLVNAMVDVFAATMIDERIRLLHEQIVWTTSRAHSLEIDRVPGQRHLCDWTVKLNEEKSREEERLRKLIEKIEERSKQKKERNP